MSSPVSRKGIATFLPAAITPLTGVKRKVRYSAWNLRVAKPVLEALVSTRRSEMQTKGITGQTDRNAIIRSHVHCVQSRRPDMLNRNVLWGEHNLVFLPFSNDGVDQLLVCGARIRPTRHCNIPQVVLKRIVAQLRRNDLKPDIDRADDDQKRDSGFEFSHVPQSALPGLGTALSCPAEQLLKILHDRRDPN